MGRAPCCEKDGLKKGPWTPEEDQKLIDYIQIHGHGSWRTLPKNAGLQRCGKSCRLRWTNYLRPDIKRGRFSFEEEETIIQLHSILGNKWSAIAARLPGRTDNEIKNYWNTHIRKRLLRMGIDPVTHSLRLDLLDLSSVLNSTQQFNVSQFLGAQPVIDPEIIRLATSLLSSQHQAQEILQQNQFQDQFQVQSFMQNQPPIQENSTCTTSFLDENQFMQANVEQFPETPANFSYQNVDQNEYRQQYNVESMENYGYYDPSVIELLYQNSNPEFTFPSALSTPSSNPVTPLNSSSTHFNSSNDDEKDSYCSDMLKYQIPYIFNGNDIM
ncbi:hypothetical protein ACHQM5_003496 [Ranunculus cassubicifolius]